MTWDGDAFALERKGILVAFGRRVRALREDMGMSQEDLADRADVHRTEIGLIERGQREPRLSTVLILARALGAPPGALIDQLPTPTLRRTFPRGRRAR